MTLGVAYLCVAATLLIGIGLMLFLMASIDRRPVRRALLILLVGLACGGGVYALHPQLEVAMIPQSFVQVIAHIFA